MTGRDDLYRDAVVIVRADNIASTSFIQRKLQLNYNTARDLVERMEREGIVTALNNAGKRFVIPDVARVTQRALGSADGDPLVERLAFEAMQWAKSNNPGADQPSLVFARRFAYLMANACPPWRDISDAPKDGARVDLRAGNIVVLGCRWGLCDVEHSQHGAFAWTFAPSDFKPTQFRLAAT